MRTSICPREISGTGIDGSMKDWHLLCKYAGLTPWVSMNAGWPWEEFQARTGFDLRGEWSAEIAQLVHRGWAEITPTHFRLNRAGLRFADAAAQLFLRLVPASP